MVTVPKLKNLIWTFSMVLVDPLQPKNENFNFKVEEKLDQYFHVKFDKETEFDSFEATKISRNLLSDPFFLS